MALVHKRSYDKGIAKSNKRRFIVWLGDDDPGEQRLVFTNQIPLNGRDPLQALIERISERLYGRAARDLQAGGSLQGEDWSLKGRELTVQREGAEETCALQDLTAVDTVDHHLCIWRRGEDDAWVKIPLESANAFLLARWLKEQQIGGSAGNKEPAAGNGLGRVIFERRATRNVILAWDLVGILALGVTVVLSIIFAEEKKSIGAGLACGAAGVAVSLLIGLVGLNFRRGAFRCHEWGVFKSGLLGERSLRYADVAAFTYGATRVFVNGAYTGTNFVLKFEPAPASAASPIAYTASLPHADQELENLRDHIARVIATRMLQRLRAGEPVRWTAQLRFLPDEGIEYQASGLLGRKALVVIPNNEIATWNIEKGRFFMWAKGQKKPVIKESAASPNFFPGFFLVVTMFPRPGFGN